MRPKEYLASARRAARKHDYDARQLQFSSDATHKLEIVDPTGKLRRFGRVGYGDYVIYTHLEKEGNVDKGYANKKRNVFQKSHTAISESKGITNPYAPNNLALNILW